MNADGSEGDWALTINPDNSLGGTYTETKVALVFADIDSRTWQLVARDPDSHVGETYRIYGHVTQADSATGTTFIRANVDGQQQSDWYDYENNTLLSDSTGAWLSNVVQGDLFVAEVTVVSSFSYDTTMGGSTTVPLVAINSLQVTGNE